jgi:hypothetical protein
MTKNMTRKGLALGAASALVLAGFSALPANAAGLADTSFVSLAPSAGTEYAVLADDTSTGAIFTLTANEASTVTGGNLKFLVADASGVVENALTSAQIAAEANNYRTVAVADNAVVLISVVSGVGDTVKITDSTLAASLTTGDQVYFAADLNADDGTTSDLVIASDDTLFSVTVVGNDVSFVTDVNLAATTQNRVDVVALAVRVVREARDTVNKNFVVDTGTTSAGTTSNLVLQSDSLLTRSVTVTAWVDSNGNDVIDSTEYASPARTVQWIKASEVVASTSLTYPTPGDTSLTATVTLTPNLNEQQDMAAGDIKIGFTRPGSTATVAANATQNDTTRVWSASQPLGTGNWVGMPNIGQITNISGASPGVFTVSTELDVSVGDFVTTEGTDAGDGTFASAEVASAPTTSTFTVTGKNTTAQTNDVGSVRVVSRELVGVSGTTTSMTFTTVGNHGLSIGDLITTNASNTTGTTQFDVTRTAVASVPSAKSFTVAGTGLIAVGTPTTDDTGDVTYVSFIEAVAGSYTAKAQTLSAAIGNTATNFAVATSSDDVSLATTATANVQGASNDEITANVGSAIRKGELSVELTATVVDSNDVAVTAGRPVVVTLGALDSGAALVGTYTINGTAYASAVTLLTDANGKVVFTVGENDGAVGSKVEITVAPENLTGAQTADIELTWADATYTLFDLNDSAAAATSGHNSITAGGSYSYSLAALDQWKNAPADGTHRMKATTTGRTVGTDYITLTSGRAAWTVADGAITGQTAISTAFSLEELQTDSTWAANETLGQGGTALTYTTSVMAASHVDAVLLDTDGSTAYGNAVADLSDAATTVAIAAQDRRVVNGNRAAYTGAVVVSGRVSNSSTNVPRAGTVVTLSGPNNILFSEGSVDALGGVSIKTDANGEFSVELFSNTAQTNTVITVSSGADSETVKVSFTGAGASFGTSIAIDAPASVDPGTSFKVTATLRDKNGNAVLSTTGDRMLVEYAGPGIVIATMPTDTNTLGQVSFTVLLGTNDKGTGVVTVSYDQGDDGDFTGTATGDLDVIATKSLTVGAVASSDTKVTVGTYKGYVAVFTKGYAGQKLSVRLASKWHVRNPIVDLKAGYSLLTVNTGAGYVANVIVYIDGVEVERMTITTK